MWDENVVTSGTRYVLQSIVAKETGFNGYYFV